MSQHTSYSERLKWAAEQGSKNLGEKFTTGDNMNKEAQTTLTYVLAAMGATFAYAFNGLNSSMTVLVATAAIMCAFYTCLGIWLVRRTFLIGDFPSPYQEPQNLVKDPNVALDDVLLGEIAAMKERIDDAKKWITKKSEAVNFTRKALVWSPVGFVVAVAICKCLSWDIDCCRVTVVFCRAAFWETESIETTARCKHGTAGTERRCEA